MDNAKSNSCQRLCAINMRIILAILLLTISVSTFSQTKMCEENSVLYSICYELDSTGHFKYDFNHCTGSVLGSGSFKKSKKSIIFTFDSIITPVIHGQHNQLKNSIIRINRYHLLNGYPIEFAKVNYKQKSYRTDSTGLVEIDYSGGPIVVYQHHERDSIIINPDKDNFNKYEVFWQSPGDTFMKQGTIIKMTEKSGKYKFKEKLLGYDDKKDVYFPEWRITYYIAKEK